tara:strand:+ start:641 stop:2791 length:2151 start_codon:yes stop_codon:yes gene_type:complete
MADFELSIDGVGTFEVGGLPDTATAADIQAQGFPMIAQTLEPQDLSIARSKNTAFGDYLRGEAKKPVVGESDYDRDVRQYGRLGPDVGGAEGSLRGYLQGALLGGGDESMGALLAAKDAVTTDTPYNKAYPIRRDDQRRKLKEFRNTDPVKAYGSEFSGAALTSMVPMLNAVKGGNIIRGLKTGAGQGGLYGSNASDGDIVDRAKGAGIGAVLGGTLGAAIAPATTGVRNLATKLMEKRAAKAANLSVPEYQILQRAMNADDSFSGTGSQRLAAAGDDAMLAESGPTSQKLLDTAIQSGGPAARIGREAVDTRVATSAQRVGRALDETMGVPGASSSRAVVPYGTSASPMSGVYKAAYGKPVDYSSSLGKEIEDIVNNQVPIEIIAQANKLMRMKGEGTNQIMASVDDMGNVVYQSMPDVRQLDYITRGLNQAASTGEGQGALGGQTPIGNAYQRLSQRIRGALKDLVPEYKNALSMASDAISLKQSRDLGFDLLKTGTPMHDALEMISHMGKAQKGKALEGVRLHIDNMMAKVKAMFTDTNLDVREAAGMIKELSSRSNRAKLSGLMGEQEAANLFRQLDQAAQSYQLKASINNNSGTFARTTANDAVKAITEDGVLNAAKSGEAIDAAKRIIQATTGRTEAAKQQITDEIYQGLVDALTGRRGPEARALLKSLSQTGPKVGEAITNAGDRTQAIIRTLPAMPSGRLANELMRTD